jgi:hypothetical protein
LNGEWEDYDRPLRCLWASKTVKLTALKLESPIESVIIISILRKILEKQQHSLQTVEVREMPYGDVTWIVANMPQLERFACSLKSMSGPLLNNLQQLRSLTLRLRDYNCDLNITDLPLEELTIRGYRIRTKFAIVPSVKPMLAIKRLDIGFIKLKASNVLDICRLMLNLEELEATFDSRTFDSPNERKVIFGPEINNLVHLRLLNLDVIYYLPEFLQQLKLPKLQRLGVSMIHSWDVSICSFRS